MDYKVQKWMNNFAFLSKQSFPRLSSAPAKTFIDPGIAGIAPLHHLYVPLTAKKSFAHELSKQTSAHEIQPMAGTGLVEPEVPPETLSDQPKKLSDGVLYSFMHPKIETDKIVFETRPKQLKRPPATVTETIESKKPKVEKKMSHKFQFL